MSEKKRKSPGFLYFTPWRSISRARDSLSKSKENLSAIYEDLKSSLPDQPSDGVYPEGDLRNIKDTADRFEAMYALNGWSLTELDEQIRACVRTKLASLMTAILAFFMVFVFVIFSPVWMLIFLLPMAGCALILGAAQTFKFALYETQLKDRKLYSAKEFYNREDFFKKIFW